MIYFLISQLFCIRTNIRILVHLVQFRNFGIENHCPPQLIFALQQNILNLMYVYKQHQSMLKSAR